VNKQQTTRAKIRLRTLEARWNRIAKNPATSRADLDQLRQQLDGLRRQLRPTPNPGDATVYPAAIRATSQTTKGT
jgi:hypothetical protein